MKEKKNNVGTVWMNSLALDSGQTLSPGTGFLYHFIKTTFRFENNIDRTCQIVDKKY
jgi:hypothetical protein